MPSSTLPDRHNRCKRNGWVQNFHNFMWRIAQESLTLRSQRHQITEPQ